MAEDLCLKLQNGTQLVVPNRLDAITTYVILEQERWFEKEWGFIPHLLQPGMVALDIGANLGIYSMAMAEAVGATGHIFAYEPTSETRARLEKSKAVNEAENLTVLASALSDTEREGRIVFGTSSELNRLGDDAEGVGEAVHLTSLDIEKQLHGWGEIDFIKMDAEGEELKIIAGGRSVFESGSPVVMFEIKAEKGYEPRIARAFEAQGYGLYTLLPDERHLVPFAEAEPDMFELNLFAVRPDKAKALAARDILTETDDAPFAPGDFHQFLLGKPFAAVSPEVFGDGVKAEGGYGAALDDYAAWRDERQPIAARYAALRSCHRRLQVAVDEKRGVSRLLSLMRASFDLGRRDAAIQLARDALKLLDGRSLPAEPFLPPTARFETMAGRPDEWLFVGTIEAYELNHKYSSYYLPALPQLDWVSQTRLNSHELERRRALSAVQQGKNVQLRKNLGQPAPDHLNAEAWAKLIG